MWAREETVTFGDDFHTLVQSISEMNGGLSLVVEAASNAVAICSLLEKQGIHLRSNLIELIRLSMEEELQMHLGHFRKVVCIFATTDDWVLGKFLSLGLLSNQLSVSGIGDRMEYCQLTSSGRKFVTLMQAILDDLRPLVVLSMGANILKGLANLFSEYMSVLERAIPSKANAVNLPSEVSCAKTLQQQLSILANVSTLVHLLPIIAESIFKEPKSSSNNLEPTMIFSEDDFSDWILEIEESQQKFQKLICQQFVFDLMSDEDSESATSLDDWFIPSSPQEPMPSFPFQALLLQLRQLEQLSESIFISEDGTSNKLSKEIMETLILWLSNNQDIWIKVAERSCRQQGSCFDQVYLDTYFLVEIAVLGGHCSDDLMAATADLLERIEEAFIQSGLDPNWDMPDGDWAENAAKLAIKKLLEAKAAKFESEGEGSATPLRCSTGQNRKDECPIDVEDMTDTSEDSLVLLHGDSVDDITRSDSVKYTVSRSSEGKMASFISDCGNDVNESESLTETCSDEEDEGDSDKAETEAETAGLIKSEGIEDPGKEVLTVKAELKSMGNADDFDSSFAQTIADHLQVMSVNENLILKCEAPVSNLLRGKEGSKEYETETVDYLEESYSVTAEVITEKQEVEADLPEADTLHEKERKNKTAEEELPAYPDNSQKRNAIGTQLVADNSLTNKILHIDDRLGGVEKVGIISLSEVQSVDKLGGRYDVAAEAGMDDLEEDKLMKTARNLTGSVPHDPDSNASLNIDHCAPDAARLDLEKRRTVLTEWGASFTAPEELVRITPIESQGNNNFAGLAKQRDGRKKYRVVRQRSAGKKIKRPTASDSRSSSPETHFPIDSPFKHTRDGVDHRKFINFDSSHASESTVLVPSERSEFDARELEEGEEATFLELQNVEARDTLLSDELSELVLETSLREEAEEASMHGTLRTEEEEKEENALCVTLSDLKFEAGHQKQGSDCSGSPRGRASGNGAASQRGGRKRSKSNSEETPPGKNSQQGAKALRPRWH